PAARRRSTPRIGSPARAERTRDRPDSLTPESGSAASSALHRTGSSGGPRRTAPGPARSTRPPASGATALGPERQRRASLAHSLRPSSATVLVEPPPKRLFAGRAAVVTGLAQRA